MTTRRCLLYGILYLIYNVDCLQFAGRQFSRGRIAVLESPLRFFCQRSDVDGKEDREIVEYSSKDVSKYETRSKLLEAALMALRVRQSESDAANSVLTKEIKDITTKFDALQKNNRLLVAEMSKEKIALQAELKASLTDLKVEKNMRQAEDIEAAGVLMKFKNRLLLLESAYEDSEKSRKRQEMITESSRDKANLLKAAIEEKMKEILILENLLNEEQAAALELRDKLEELEIQMEKRQIEYDENIQSIKLEAEVNRKNFAERSKNIESELLAKNLENINKCEAEKKELESSYKKQNESLLKKNSVSENFNEFLTRTVKEDKLKETEISNKIEQEEILKQQKFVLEETVKLLESVKMLESTVQQKSSSQMTDTIYYFEEQDRLKNIKYDAIMDRLKDFIPPKVQDPPLDSDQNCRKNQKSEYDEDDKIVLEDDKTVLMKTDREDLDMDIDQNQNIDIDATNGNEIDGNEKLLVDFIDDFPENIPEGVPQSDSIGDELISAATEIKSTVTTFFSNLITELSEELDDGRDDNIKDDDNNNSNDNNIGGNSDIDTYDKNNIIRDQTIDNERKNAQENRLKRARQSGRFLRNFGGLLVKSTVNTLGFWVGLGFEDDGHENQNENEKGNGGGNRNRNRNRNGDGSGKIESLSKRELSDKNNYIDSQSDNINFSLLNATLISSPPLLSNISLNKFIATDQIDDTSLNNDDSTIYLDGIKSEAESGSDSESVFTPESN